MLIASPFISGLFWVIFRRLTSLLEGEVPTLLELKDGLQDLHSKMDKVGILIKQAEENALTDTSVNMRLLDLQDTVYKIDDIIDDCDIERWSLGQQVTAPSTPRTPRTKICQCFSCDVSCFSLKRGQHKMDRMIKEVSDKLEQIEQEEELHKVLSFNGDSQLGLLDHVQTRGAKHYPIGILGEAVKDVEQVVEWLRTEVQKQEDGLLVRVMVIAGKAGVGKTALAQRVFHHPTIESGCIFKKRVWVSMFSKHYDEKSMLLEMVREIVGMSYEGCASPSAKELIESLKTVVAEKDILWIMDGMDDGDTWENCLTALFQIVGNGSRVLITTRCEELCARIPTSQVRKLGVMSESDALILLCKNAFSYDEKDDFQDLKKIGLEVVKRCRCIPQAIETIGRLLWSKPRERIEWEKVLQHFGWSLNLVGSLEVNQNYVEAEVINAQVISYLDLPLPHKQCLIYCSVFPYDRHFNKQQIVKYWIAENLLQIEDGPKMEIMGENIFKELVDRGFLVSSFNHMDEKRVHSLMRLLANPLRKEENFGTKKPMGEGSIHRSSFIDENSLKYYNFRKHHQRLRTKMFLNSQGLREVPKSLFKKLPYLRVLCLCNTGITMLPNSINYLVHLKLLDVSFTPIESLPDQLGDLCCLMFLILVACKSLHTLPKSIVKLSSLRSINLSNCEIHRMPRMMRELKHLQLLVWGLEKDEEKASWSIMEEIFHLANLTELSLSNLENISSALRAKEARLQDKLHLRCLRLSCKLPNGADEQGVKRIEEVFEELQPPPCLKELEISGFYGHKMPCWISSRQELTKMVLENCEFCPNLPCLGQISRLEELVVKNASSIGVLGPEFFGSKQPFPKLELLSFQGLHNLKECSFNESENSGSYGGSPFLKLKDLRFSNCPNLPSLWGCLSEAACLSALHLKNLESLVSIPDLPALKKLYITNCPSVSRIGMFRSLEDLHWADDTNQVLSPWIGLLKSQNVSAHAPSLQNMYINTFSCRLLRRVCPWDIGIDWPLLMNVPHVCAYWPNSPFFLEFSNASPMRIRGRLPKSYFDFKGNELRSIVDGNNISDGILSKFKQCIQQEFVASSSGLQEDDSIQEERNTAL